MLKLAARALSRVVGSYLRVCVYATVRDFCHLGDQIW